MPKRQPLPYSHSCFVCGADNDRGLRLRFSTVDDQVFARCRLGSWANGFAFRAHGGIVASLLDEAMGWATVLAGGRFTYTGELNVRYRAPVPLDEELVVVAWVERHTRRLSFARGELRLAKSPDERSTLEGVEGLLAENIGLEGTVLAFGEGKFAPLDEQTNNTVRDALIYPENAWQP